MYSLWGHIVGSSHCKNKQTRGYCLTSDCATCIIQRETSLKDQVQHKELIRPKFIITYRAENGEHCWKYLLHFWHLRNVLFPFQAPKNLQSVLEGITPLVHQTALGVMTVTPEQDSGASTSLSAHLTGHKVSQSDPGPMGDLWQVTRPCRGHTKPSTSQECKTCLKKTKIIIPNFKTLLWLAVMSEAEGFPCTSTSLYFIKRNLLSILDRSYRKLLINSLPQKGSFLNPK